MSEQPAPAAEPVVPTVLVVDDDEDIRELTRMSLELTAGWTVLTASNGPDAIELCQAQRPDAVLLDMMMPGMDGTEVAERLGADEATAEIPLIFFTAKIPARSPATVDQPRRKAIAKPFDPMTLADNIVALLGWPARA